LSPTDTSTTRATVSLARPHQLLGSFGARLLKELGRGGQPSPAGPPAEFGQTLGDPVSLLGFIADQRGPENLPMLRLGGASVLCRPYPQAADGIVPRLRTVSVAIAEDLMLSNAAMTAYDVIRT